MITPPSEKRSESSSSSRRLVFRLSSLGDVILATAILRDGVRTDWVCGEEYVSLLQGHPGIGRVIGFSRGAGTGAWIRLCSELAGSGQYSEVVDLHGSLRTRVARWVWAIKGPRSVEGAGTAWRSIRKERTRRGLYAVLKSLLPQSFRPTPYLNRVLRLTGGGPTGRRLTVGTDLSHLLQGGATAIQGLEGAPYFAVMPSSRWPSKEWPAMAFADALERLIADGRSGMTRTQSTQFLILGRATDRASVELLAECKRRGLADASGPVSSGIGDFSYAQLAGILKRARGYIGMDTGLAHLAEAVGTDVLTIFGPTTPGYGFGPWRTGSLAVGKKLWCRPCSKDGNACFRVSRSYACIKEFTAADAGEALLGWARAKVRS